MKTIAKMQFKQTDAGMIPEDWEIVCLGHICSKIGSGFTPRGAEKVYKESGVVLIRSQNVYNNSFSKEGLVYLDESTAKEMENVTVEKDDILLNITGDSVARCCTVPKEILPARVNQHVCIIRTKREQLNPIFLRYYLTSPKMQAFMLGLAQSGGTRSALTKEMIERFLVPKPTLKEQTSIARMLSDIDSKIELNRQMNKIIESMGNAIFKHWFIAFEFPNEEGKPYKSSGGEMVYNEELMKEVPKGWESGSLGDVAENPRRGIQPDAIEPGTPYIGLEHMPRKSIALSDWETAEGIVSNKFRFRKGEVLFGKLRPYFHKVGVAPLNGVCSTDILVIVPKSPNWHGFVLFHVSSEEFVRYADAVSTGTRMPRSNWEDMSRYDIAIPTNSVVNAFNDKIAPLVEKVCTNILLSRILADIRDSLLPKLMSGKKRVPIEVR